MFWALQRPFLLALAVIFACFQASGTVLVERESSNFRRHTFTPGHLESSTITGQSQSTEIPSTSDLEAISRDILRYYDADTVAMLTSCARQSKSQNYQRFCAASEATTMDGRLVQIFYHGDVVLPNSFVTVKALAYLIADMETYVFEALGLPVLFYRDFEYTCHKFNGNDLAESYRAVYPDSSLFRNDVTPLDFFDLFLRDASQIPLLGCDLIKRADSVVTQALKLQSQYPFLNGKETAAQRHVRSSFVHTMLLDIFGVIPFGERLARLVKMKTYIDSRKNLNKLVDFTTPINATHFLLSYLRPKLPSLTHARALFRDPNSRKNSNLAIIFDCSPRYLVDTWLRSILDPLENSLFDSIVPNARLVDYLTYFPSGPPLPAIAEVPVTAAPVAADLFSVSTVITAYERAELAAMTDSCLRVYENRHSTMNALRNSESIRRACVKKCVKVGEVATFIYFVGAISIVARDSHEINKSLLKLHGLVTAVGGGISWILTRRTARKQWNLEYKNKYLPNITEVLEEEVATSGATQNNQ